MKLLQWFIGDYQGGFNFKRRLFANVEKKYILVFRNTFIMRSTNTISLNAGEKLKIIYILKACCQFCQLRKVTSWTLVLRNTTLFKSAPFFIYVRNISVLIIYFENKLLPSLSK